MSLQDLTTNVQKLDSIQKEVVATKEASIEAEGFKLLSNIGQKQVEHFTGEAINFDVAVFAEKLITFMGGRREGATGQDLDWSKLGQRALTVFKRAPTFSFM